MTGSVQTGDDAERRARRYVVLLTCLMVGAMLVSGVLGALVTVRLLNKGSPYGGPVGASSQVYRTLAAQAFILVDSQGRERACLQAQPDLASLRFRDKDGDVIKLPGRIKVQLLDNTDLSKPRLVGLYEFSSPDELRDSWYGKFGTQHYTLKCPFAPGTKLPDSRRLNLTVEFVDYLTGSTLTATEEVAISLVDE